MITSMPARHRAVVAIAAALLVALAFAPRPAVASARIVGAVPERYTVNLEWMPSARVLSGTSAITVKNAGGGPLSRVWVRLWPNSIAPTGGGDCAKARARITSVTGGTIGEYRVRCSAAAVDLPRALSAGERATFTLAYRMTVPTSEGGFGRDLGVDYLGNAVPVVAVRDERGLQLPPYPDFGEADYHLVADWRTSIRVPSDQQVAMTGLETSTTGGGHATYSADARVRDVAIAVADFHTRTASVGGVRLRVVGGRQVRDKLDAALRRLETTFRTFQDWYGGYPLADLDVVVGRFSFGGTEYPGIVLSNPDLATVAHEVAHQWFYALVGNDQYNDPWLDESFATWNEQQFDAYYECDPADPLNGSPRGLSTGMDYWDLHSDEYDDVVYRGGYCALTRLELDIGHANFLAVLRDYVAHNANGVARSEDFLDEVRAVAPAYDVDAWARLVGLM